MPQGNDVAICGLVLTVLGATRARPLRWDLHLTKYQGTGGNYFVLSKSLILNKLTSVFHASVLLLIMNFVITLSK